MHASNRMQAGGRVSAIAAERLRRRPVLLAGTALAGGLLATVLAAAQSARAACSTATAAATTTVTCAADTATTNTTHFDGNAAITIDRIQAFTNDTVGLISNGVSITGFGLQFAPTGANNAITVTNNGLVSSGTNSVAALQLSGN